MCVCARAPPVAWVRVCTGYVCVTASGMLCAHYCRCKYTSSMQVGTETLVLCVGVCTCTRSVCRCVHIHQFCVYTCANSVCRCVYMHQFCV